MLINIDHEPERLAQAARTKTDQRDTHPDYHPYVVTIYSSRRSRSPIFVRRKTLQEAMVFVEEVTGLSAIRWMTHRSIAGQLHAWTGAHLGEYRNHHEYKAVQS